MEFIKRELEKKSEIFKESSSREHSTTLPPPGTRLKGSREVERVFEW